MADSSGGSRTSSLWATRMVASLLSIAVLVISADDASKTLVSIELLAPRGAMGLESQQWARVFDELDVTVRIRAQQLDDKVEIAEKQRGSLRFVTARGVLRNDGSIAFSNGKSFTLANTAQLKSWLDGVRVYGAAGTPEENEDWGLTASGQSKLGRSLAQTATPPKTMDALGVAEHLQASAGMAVRFTEEARRHRYDECLWPTGSIAIGTAAAAAFESVGLGFAPQRLPNGGSELVVDVRDEAKHWPVGWAIPRGTPPGLFAKSLFDTVQLTGLSRTLPTYFSEIAKTTSVPIIVLRGEVDAQLPDWHSIPVPVGQRASAPVMTLTRVVRKNGMSYAYRLDDAGTPFVAIRVQDSRRQAINAKSPPPAVAARLRQFKAQF